MGPCAILGDVWITFPLLSINSDVPLRQSRVIHAFLSLHACAFNDEVAFEMKRRSWGLLTRFRGDYIGLIFNTQVSQTDEPWICRRVIKYLLITFAPEPS